MTKSPIINAFAALAYITLVASVMYYGPKESGAEDTVIIPIAIISLFTLSAAMMGYIFLYYPLQLYFDSDKKGAVTLFLRTLAIFGGITALLLVLLVAIGTRQ